MKRILIIGFTFLLISFVQSNVRAQSHLGQPMSDVILPDTKPSDWPVIRSSIENRISKVFGEGPVPFGPNENVNYKIESEYEEYGLAHFVIKYEVFPGSWDRGILVLPKDFDDEKKYKAVLTIHGTNGSKGANGTIDYDGSPGTAYGIELAYRGVVTFSPDQFSFGESIKDIARDSLIKEFDEKYPDWSIIHGRTLLGFMRALDVLDKLEFIDNSNGYGVTGISLGGKASINIAAVDERITVAAPFCGVSPNFANGYRTHRFQPEVSDFISETLGLYPFEVHELIALIAPKSILFVEPINDPYNRYVNYTVKALLHAAPVWRLLGKPENFSFIINGDGHSTPEHVRNYAYDWLIRNLNKQ